MYKNFSDLVQKLFIDNEIWVFILTLLIPTALLMHFSNLLMPALIALGFAYLFNNPLEWLCSRGIPRLTAVWLVFGAFVGIMVALLSWLLPIISLQSQNLFRELPNIFASVQHALSQMSTNYPALFDQQAMNEAVIKIKTGVSNYGTDILFFTFTAIPSVIQGVVYFVLVPMLVFFYLKDKAVIFAWVNRLLPKRRQIFNHVCDEVNNQLGNYVSGKVIELTTIGLLATISFSFLGLSYAFLLGLLVGLSVIIPVVGVLLVSVPVIAIAFWQWGLSQPFYTVAAVYAIIQILDANVLVPLLFSETLNLHPIAIIIAILFFGGVWGFWGIFFAIPLATVVKALTEVWLTERGA